MFQKYPTDRLGMITVQQRYFIGKFLLFITILSWAKPSSADELTFYAYPSPYGIDWQSPGALTRSTLVNQLADNGNYKKQHTIGHVNVEINCEASATSPAIHFLTGMTNSDDSEMNSALLDKGHGLGILLETFKGRMESTEEIEQDLAGRYREGKIAFLHYSISPQLCRRVADYINEYGAHGYGNFYGLPNRPRYREGSGCTAFGVSVLEIAGLMDDEFTANWSRFIRVPRSLVGGDLTGKRISLVKLLWGRHSYSWAREDENFFPLFFWDPDLIYSWIKNKCSELTDSESMTPYRAEIRDHACGLYLDRASEAVPGDSFWFNSPASE